MLTWLTPWLLAVVASAGTHVPLEGPLDAAATPADLVVPDPLPPDAPYPSNVYRAAASLRLSRAFVHEVARGLDLLYERRYKDCRAHFSELEQVFPGTAVAPIGELLVWQSAMLENFDFRYDDQYRAASKLARAKLDAAQRVPGNEAWEEVLLGVVIGLEAIHDARQSRYLGALSGAIQAVDHIGRAQGLAPGFTDLELANGLYGYWRTVITEQSKALPNFGDERQVSLDRMRQVVDDGVFLVAPARLSLAFSWFEEHDYAKARDDLTANYARYPGSVINSMMLGLAFTYLNATDAALTMFDHVAKLDPTNQRMHYYRGRTLHRAKRLDEAAASYETYLGFETMEPYQRAGAYFRLGQVRMGQKRWAEAEAAFVASLKIDKSDAARNALDRFKRLEREGKLAAEGE